MGYLRRPMQIPRTIIEDFTTNIKNLFKIIPLEVLDYGKAYVNAQKDLNKNLYPVNNVGDLICQANEAAQLSAAVIDRQIEFSKLSDELKGRSLLIHFISDLMGHDDAHELVFRRHAETSHIPPVGEYTLFTKIFVTLLVLVFIAGCSYVIVIFCKRREIPWILTWALSSAIVFIGDIFLIESASIWFVRVILTSLIGKNMKDAAQKLDLHLSVLLPKVIRSDNKIMSKRRNNFASINKEFESNKLSEYESDYEWKKKHLNACEILFVSNYIAKKDNFKMLPESTFILEYRDPYPENSGKVWRNVALDIDKVDSKESVVNHIIQQGLEWLLMIAGFNLWVSFISSNNMIKPKNDLSHNNNDKNNNGDNNDDSDEDEFFYLGDKREWSKTSLDNALCDGLDKASKRKEDLRSKLGITKDNLVGNSSNSNTNGLTKNGQKRFENMEKNKNQISSIKNNKKKSKHHVVDFNRMFTFEYLFL